MSDAPPPRRRRKIPLSADRIAAEAMAMVDHDGYGALSFRALAKRLGCEAMSLYHYFPSKAHLTDAMVSICLAETPIPADDLPHRDRLRRFAFAYRDTVLRHPGFAQILVTHRLNHRDGLSFLERATALFDAPGLSIARQAHLFRVMSYYLTGAAIDEALGYARGPGAAEPVPGEDARRDFPRITAFGAHFGPDSHLPIFEAGLDLILDWIEAEMQAARDA
ncbi:MAG: TetR/AcrR family transcriptional regulator C-terminal domain-containing protein [Rhodobacteraceae bacterium]|nr:TetR/AcrR family transcriptional regulator C-terminal domain-containing protein [Paracoccaceae bacterium]